MVVRLYEPPGSGGRCQREWCGLRTIRVGAAEGVHAHPVALSGASVGPQRGLSHSKHNCVGDLRVLFWTRYSTTRAGMEMVRISTAASVKGRRHWLCLARWLSARCSSQQMTGAALRSRQRRCSRGCLVSYSPAICQCSRPMPRMARRRRASAWPARRWLSSPVWRPRS